MLTEVRITENTVATSYATLVPTGEVLSVWLEKIVLGVLIAPSNQRMFAVPRTNLTIDRKNVTQVVVTRDSS